MHGEGEAEWKSLSAFIIRSKHPASAAAAALEVGAVLKVEQGAAGCSGGGRGRESGRGGSVAAARAQAK